MKPVIPIPNLLKQPMLWRCVGFMSSVIGLLCYALSSSFKNLFGEWNLLKIFLYGVASFIICTFVLFAKKWQVSSGLMLKAHVGFLVLMVTSVYSFFYDKAVKGKADILGLLSCGAFAFMSFSLSRQINLGFEVDLLNFFIGCLTVQLMKINLMFAPVGAVFCCVLIGLRSSLDSQVQIGDVSVTDHVSVEIEAANGLEKVSDHGSNKVFRSEHSSQPQELPSLRRRKIAEERTVVSPTIDDDHAWRKYRRRPILGSEFPMTYFRCPRRKDQGCQAMKQVQKIQENPDMYEITYRGLHTCKNTPEAAHSITNSDTSQSVLLNPHPDSKVPNERDYLISSSNSSSTINQENPKKDTPVDFQRKIAEKVKKGTVVSPTIHDNHAWRKYGQEGILGSEFVRKVSEKGTVVSPTTDDNQAWRKYGQKEILGYKFPRTYFRCPRRKDQGCQAMKQVQKIQENPDMYEITYRGLHTCRNTLEAPDLITDSDTSQSVLLNPHPDSKVPNEQDYLISSSNSRSTINQENPKKDTPIDFHRKITEKVKKRTAVSPTIHDNHARRKYGQQAILGSEFPRLKPKKKNQKKQPRFTLTTTSEVDHLGDGYMWRNYDQKGCEQQPLSQELLLAVALAASRSWWSVPPDSSIVVSTYEGQHTHPCPATS